jgi:hypothetical protein
LPVGRPVFFGRTSSQQRSRRRVGRPRYFASRKALESQRRHVHTRSIRVDAYARDDGLWDIEAVLVDTKSRDLQLVSGLRAAGEPVHEMRLRVTIDTDLNVRDASASTSWVPYPGYCNQIEPEYKRLVGLNLARSLEEVKAHASSILGMQLVTHQTGPQGQKVRRLLIEEGADIRKELYVGLVIDRATQRVCLMASSEGGMDIEEVAEHTPEKIHKVYVDPSRGLTDAEADDIATKIGVPAASLAQARTVLQGL